MSFSVYLVSESGAVIDGPCIDPTNVLGKLLPSSEEAPGALLAYVDPYGDTIFNGLQARWFMVEWAALPLHGLNDEEVRFLSTVGSLAERCIGETHSYLKIVGD
jgi:hypothetical protein